MPFIDGVPDHECRENKVLPINSWPDVAINGQSARIFDKNTMRHIFSG